MLWAKTGLMHPDPCRDPRGDRGVGASKPLTELEEALGISLFVRQAKGMTDTVYGLGAWGTGFCVNGGAAKPATKPPSPTPSPVWH